MKATVTDIIPAVLPGVFPARLDTIEEKSNETGKYWLWSFTLAVPALQIGDMEQWAPAEGEGGSLIPVTGTTSPRITPRTKAAKWVEALGKVKVEVGTEIDLEALHGKHCQVVIIIAETGYSRIDAVLPAPEAAPPIPTAAPVNVADEAARIFADDVVTDEPTTPPEA
jgi:hypothetical protein